VIPDVSVIVVHWNVPHLLRACLTSIDAERERADLSLQVIVVDNASDRTGAREAVARVPDVELLELPENRGFAGGGNAGIALAAGHAVLVLNPDTELRPGAIDVLWQTLHVAAHVGLVAPLLLNPDGSLQSHGYRFPGVANMVLDLFPVHPRLVESPLNGRVRLGDGHQPVRIDYPLGAAMLLRRAALTQVGGFDETYTMYSEEVDLARRLAEAGWTTLLAPAARIIHHGGQSTGQRPAAMYEALWESRARYFARWGTPLQRRLIPAVVGIGTRFDDRRADAPRRSSNARIRDRFRRLGGDQP
jgi:GT2 family glycosyltransferase